MIASQPRLERGRRFRWQLAPRVHADRLTALEVEHPLLAQILHNRGIADAESARRHLRAEHETLAPAESMAGLTEAVERLTTALHAGELIALYGDYDVDGLTATALLALMITRLGGRVLPFIPHRERDGYGLQDGPLSQLRAAGATLVVTVDCGVTAVDEIARARTLGLDVIVTDHHLVSTELPAAIVVNPRRPDCKYPYKELTGAGVASRLADALASALLPASDARVAVDEVLDLAALGTLADVASLRGENRTIVRRGLARLRTTPRPGLLALMRRAAIEPSRLNGEQASFALIPRLNAAGRLDDANLSLQLLLSDSPEEATVLAEQLESLNRLRKRRTAEALSSLRADLRSQDPGAAIVLVADIPVGLAGLLASRLAEEFGRPAVVLRPDGERCFGSARSVGSLNLIELFSQHRELLDRFGGHAMAAGLSLPARHLTRFREVLSATVAAASPEPLIQGPLVVDAELSAFTATRRGTLDVLSALEPFGADYPEPVFLSRQVRVLSVKSLSRGGTILRLSAAGVAFEALTFEAFEVPNPGSLIDLVYHLKRDAWRGEVKPRLALLDWRHAAA